MSSLSTPELYVVFAIFIWSGFVRTALGFGGAALSLPLFLFVVKDPVDIIPIIGIHLLLTVIVSFPQYSKNIDFSYLGKTLPWMIPFKIAGVIGLLSLSATVINIGVYLLTMGYALSYIFQRRLHFRSALLERGLLAAGSYFSGTSLIGAPLIIAVYSQYLPPIRLRATLFALWFILVVIKLLGFIITDTPLQLKWAIITLPFAWFGQVFGDKLHRYMLQFEQRHFMRWIGVGLLLVCLLGLGRMLPFDAP